MQSGPATTDLGRADLVRLQRDLGLPDLSAPALQLLRQALTHRSVQSRPDNERLEFLGDAVLQLVVTQWLYAKHPCAAEGELSRWRAHYVCEATLAAWARTLNLSRYLALGKGELRSGGAQRTSILADALEAIIGAVYLSLGMPVATQMVQTWLERAGLPGCEVLSSGAASGMAGQAGGSVGGKAEGKDAKTQLQERLQAAHLDLPQYRIERTAGTEHEPVFTVSCSVVLPQAQIRQVGTGRSRRQAEQDAAAQVLRVCVERKHFSLLDGENHDRNQTVRR